MKKINKLRDLQGEIIKIKNNTTLDRYGFSYILANKLKFRHPPRPFCNWIHGWYYWDDIMEVEDIVGMNGCPINTSIIVNTSLEKDKLNDAGYLNVTIGGLPFAYVSEQRVKRNKKALMAFISHSSESEIVDVIDLDYLNYLESIKDKFEIIYVSIYSIDQNPLLLKEIIRRGLVPSVGANPFDKRSLIRTHIALEYCEYVSTNTFGSHIAYALSAGCRLSIFSPCHKYDATKHLGTNQNYDFKYVERIERYKSETYLRSRWNYLFDRSADDGYKNIELGLQWIGKKKYAQR